MGDFLLLITLAVLKPRFIYFFCWVFFFCLNLGCLFHPANLGLKMVLCLVDFLHWMKVFLLLLLKKKKKDFCRPPFPFPKVWKNPAETFDRCQGTGINFDDSNVKNCWKCGWMEPFDNITEDRFGNHLRSGTLQWWNMRCVCCVSGLKPMG